MTVDELEALQDAPAGTAEQKFMLMLHERLLKVEEDRDEMAAQLRVCTARLDLLGAQEYDAPTNRFSDGRRIVWSIREPIDTAQVGASLGARPMAYNYWDAPVTLPVISVQLDQLSLLVPVARNGCHMRHLILPLVITVRRLLEALHTFYATPICEKDIEGRHADTDDKHLNRVRVMLREHGPESTLRPCWRDLLCSPDPMGDIRAYGPLFFGNGIVYYNGIHSNYERTKLTLTLRLG
jgi:hypothetical protein